MKKLRMFSSRGFTFIELMMVVLIISILTAALYPRIVGRGKDAKIAAAKSDISSISLALEMYFVDNGKYPTTSQGLEALNRKPTTFPIPSNWKGPYMKKQTGFTDPWGGKYSYTSPGVHSEDFDLKSYGPDAGEGGGDDINSWEE